MAPAPLRVLVIGAGRMGAIRVEDLSPLVEQVFVTNRTASVATDLAGQFGATAIAWSALADLEVDAYVVTTASALHADLLTMLIPRGRPILCEKPLALTMADTDQLISLIDAHRTMVQVGFQRRFDPEIAQAKERVATGQVGTLYAIHAFSHDHRPSSPAFMSQAGDIFADLLVHDFDLISGLFDSPFQQVFASLQVREHQQYGNRADGVRDGDVALVHAVLANGVQVAITGTRHDPVGHDVHMEIFGAGDSITVGINQRTPMHPVLGGLPMAINPYGGFVDRFRSAFAAETAAFVNAVSTRAPSLCHAKDARRAFLVAQSCSESVATGHPVTITA
ncbi:MAG: Gfo/Idh/MocA family oxidoreductase [Actinomycetales bacterium]